MNSIVKAEAKDLRGLFEQRVTKSQAEFGRENDLGSGSMVYQYLSARRALGLLAGVRFAIGLGVELRSFSPRLATELERALQVLPKSKGSTNQPTDYVRVRCVQLHLQPYKHEYKFKPLNEVGAFIAFRDDWMRQRNYESSRLLAIQTNDEGMRPTLSKGDLIVINTANLALADAAVFAINYEGELRIRRLVRDTGSWWLCCDNSDMHRFPRKQFIEKHCYILGRVVHRQSEMV